MESVVNFTCRCFLSVYSPLFKKKKKARLGIYYKQKQLSWSSFNVSHRIAAVIDLFVCPSSVVIGNCVVKTKLNGIPALGQVLSVHKSLLLPALPLSATALTTVGLGVFDVSSVKLALC